MRYPQCLPPVDMSLILQQEHELRKQQEKLQAQQQELLHKQFQLLQQKRLVIESQFHQYQNVPNSFNVPNLSKPSTMSNPSNPSSMPNSFNMLNTSNPFSMPISPMTKSSMNRTSLPVTPPTIHSILTSGPAITHFSPDSSFTWESPPVQLVAGSTYHGGICTLSSPPPHQFTFTISANLHPTLPSQPGSSDELPSYLQPDPPKQIDTAKILDQTSDELESSCWFHGSLTWQQSTDLLANAKPGTFLVRDSQDPRFLYSLSVQREEGPTSVRIQFAEGKFRLDSSDPSTGQLLPSFSSVAALVQHYVDREKTMDEDDAVLVGLDSGKEQPPITLKKPLYKAPPSLAHWSRLAINKNLKKETCDLDCLELPHKLVDYIKAYPLTI